MHISNLGQVNCTQELAVCPPESLYPGRSVERKLGSCEWDFDATCYNIGRDTSTPISPVTQFMFGAGATLTSPFAALRDVTKPDLPILTKVGVIFPFAVIAYFLFAQRR